jgi:Spy/CpxP family protein refolding chaperone
MRILSVSAGAAAVLLFAAAATAQPPGGGGFMRNPAMLLGQESVRKDLKLSDEQSKKVEEFSAKMREKMQDAFALEGDERRTKMQEIMKESEKAVADLLKPDQTKRLKQIGYQLQGSTAFTTDDVVKALSITDDQKKEIQKINQESFAQMRELFQGGTPPDADTMKKVQALRKEATEKATKVLTDEQKKKWKELTGEEFKGEIRFGRPG